MRAIRNLFDATVEADANVLRRYELAHSRQLNAETMGTFDFSTLPEHRVAATKIDFSKSSVRRHLRGDGQSPVLAPYEPFGNAAKSRAVTPAQAELQATRTEREPPFAHYEPRPPVSYAFKKWKEIELGPELFR